MGRWVTVECGLWRTYENKKLLPAFVRNPRYLTDNDVIARVQIVRRKEQTNG